MNHNISDTVGAGSSMNKTDTTCTKPDPGWEVCGAFPETFLKRGAMKRKPREFEEKRRNNLGAGGHSGGDTRKSH